MNNEQSTTQKPNENLAREFLEFISTDEFQTEIPNKNINEDEFINFKIDYDYFKDILPLPRSRFSKYCRGIELVN